MNKLKLAFLISNVLSLPINKEKLPPGHSASPENLMYSIAENMVSRGHDVTLFASGNSKTNAHLESVSYLASYEDEKISLQNHKYFELMLASKCYKKALQGDFDVIHSSFLTESAYFADLVKTPTIATLHSSGAGVYKQKDYVKFLANAQSYVSISFTQRRFYPDLNYVANIYHGIDLNKFTFSKDYNDNMVFEGRIHPEKGIEDLFKLKKESNKELLLLGTIPDEFKVQYFEEIKNSKIQYMGFISREELSSIMCKSKVAIHPALFEEPFGLSLIEYMACGIPVIAYSRGSIPEVIKDGETGFIIDVNENDRRGDWIIKETGIKGLKEALERIYALSTDEYSNMRIKCRQQVEEKFNQNLMMEEYEKLYKKMSSIK